MSKVMIRFAKSKALSLLPWHTVTTILVVAIMTPLGACADRRVEVTHLRPYSELVGAQYRITGDVAAYGIYRYPQRDKVLYAAIIPGAGIAGPEVAYRIPVPAGTIVSIQKVVKSGVLFNSTIEYSVAVTNDLLPKGVELRLELSRGNEGEGLSLNPKFYERIKYLNP